MNAVNKNPPGCCGAWPPAPPTKIATEMIA
jgi:hypothetical protein